MNTEKEHEEFVDWLYLGQTEVEPDELNEKVVKCMWLAWQARQVYANRRKKNEHKTT